MNLKEEISNLSTEDLIELAEIIANQLCDDIYKQNDGSAYLFFFLGNAYQCSGGNQFSEFCKDLAVILSLELSHRIKNQTSEVTRVEVIDSKGRSYVNWKEGNKVSLSLQDDNRTLKIFITSKEQ